MFTKNCRQTRYSSDYKEFFNVLYCVDIQKERDFSKPFEQGAPNLVITPAGILLVFMHQDIVLY